MNKYLRKDLIDNWNRVNGDWIEEVNRDYEERKLKDLIDKFYRAFEEKEYQAAAEIADTIFKKEEKK